MTVPIGTMIPVAEPILGQREREYVLECLDTGWISGSGRFVDEFEREFARFCGVRHAISVANGTVALHVVLVALGIGPGDEVIVPDFTYIASANAVTYCGARVVLADVTPDTWCLDLKDAARKVTPATRAVIAVHMYGHPVDMDRLDELAVRHKLHVVEDAAEAHGAEYKSRRVGGLGGVGTFSFYGNKIITTGEGGMITTNSDDLAARIRMLKGQGMDPKRRYWFPVVGFNYRMTNVQAAIGLAQLERVDWFIARRREVAAAYRHHLTGAGLVLPHQEEWARSVFWLYGVCVPEGVDRDLVMHDMALAGIETRPFFVPMHASPPYLETDGDVDYPVSAALGRSGVSLPSSATLTDEHVGIISRVLRESVARQLKQSQLQI
ncbi:MAG TPA: DegT/DnrJ/EryC1/StrS family aminotransferase [Chloroflexota bacterium]|nr:DegT/DnrJ/EryC1/StrS family aminotransferase [Chloroflexota bacterium]